MKIDISSKSLILNMTFSQTYKRLNEIVIGSKNRLIFRLLFYYFDEISERNKLPVKSDDVFLNV